MNKRRQGELMETTKKAIKTFLAIATISLLTFLSLSPAPALAAGVETNKLEGQWVGPGEFSNNKNGREECAKMTWALSQSKHSLKLSYEFICESFNFIDSIALRQEKDRLLQGEQEVGTIQESQDSLILILEGARFELDKGGKIHVRAELDKSSRTLNYSDKYIYSGGLIDYFQSTMQKQ